MEESEETDRRIWQGVNAYCAASELLELARSEIKEEHGDIQITREFSDALKVEIINTCLSQGELSAIDLAKKKLVAWKKLKIEEKKLVQDMKLARYKASIDGSAGAESAASGTGNI